MSESLTPSPEAALAEKIGGYLDSREWEYPTGDTVAEEDMRRICSRLGMVRSDGGTVDDPTTGTTRVRFHLPTPDDIPMPLPQRVGREYIDPAAGGKQIPQAKADARYTADCIALNVDCFPSDGSGRFRSLLSAIDNDLRSTGAVDVETIARSFLRRVRDEAGTIVTDEAAFGFNKGTASMVRTIARDVLGYQIGDIRKGSSGFTVSIEDPNIAQQAAPAPEVSPPDHPPYPARLDEIVATIDRALDEGTGAMIGRHIQLSPDDYKMMSDVRDGLRQVLAPALSSKEWAQIEAGMKLAQSASLITASAIPRMCMTTAFMEGPEGSGVGVVRATTGSQGTRRLSYPPLLFGLYDMVTSTEELNRQIGSPTPSTQNLRAALRRTLDYTTALYAHDPAAQRAALDRLSVVGPDNHPRVIKGPAVVVERLRKRLA